MRYEALISRDGGARVARFPDCPGCHTQADPGEDIGRLAQDALEGWLETHLVLGRVPPLPSSARRRRRGKARVIAVPVAPTLAARIQLRHARHRAGLSQGELARRLGVSQQQVAALEAPDSNMSLATLARVAEALGCEVQIGLVEKV